MASYYLGLAAIYTIWNTHKHTSMIQNLFLSGAMPNANLGAYRLYWQKSAMLQKSATKIAEMLVPFTTSMKCALKNLQVPSSDKFALGKLWVVLLLEMRIVNLKHHHHHHHQTSLPIFIFHSSFFGGSIGSSIFSYPPQWAARTGCKLFGALFTCPPSLQAHLS